MKLKSVTVQRLATMAAIGLLALHLGCSGRSDSPAARKTADEPSVAEPPATQTTADGTPLAQATPDAAAKTPPADAMAGSKIVVPEGTPEELLEFLNGLQTRQPPAQDPESVRVFLSDLGQAIFTASDRILAAKPSEELASEAVQYKLGALSLLERAGDESVAARRAAIPAELEAAGFGSLIRIVELEGLFSRFQQLGMAGKEAYASFAEDLAKFFEKAPPEPEEAGLAMHVAGALERILKPEEVAKYYERYGKIFAGSDDEQAAQMGATMVGAARRLQLMGNEMPLDGLTLDGKKFEWNAYRGKVVLVDFWATWCGPCLDEMANIRENYDKYHDRGFEVVGISIDQDREALVSFLKDNQLPWTILVDQDLALAEQETMATRYGIFGIPNVTLVDKDGKVVSTNPRGPELGQRLADLLGEAATPEMPAETPTETPTETPQDSSAKESDKPKPDGT